MFGRKTNNMKCAVVTGASSGIGYEISKILVDFKIKVYGFGRNFEKNLIDSSLFIPVVCDITKIENLCNKINEIKKDNMIDILVNNAGIGYFGPHEEMNTKKISEMVTTNLEIPMIITQLLLRDLKKQKGYIINISSITAKKTNTHGCTYGATKAGLTSFSKSLFDEVRKYGVKVITIHPDITKSNFYRNADFKEGDTLDSYINPKEIANIIEIILKQRDGIIISDITVQPQKHMITKIRK